MCLKEINRVQKVSNRFYMRKNRFYFQIYNGSNKQVYSCRHEHTVDQWVEYINMAINYQEYIEKELSNEYIHRIIMSENQQAQVLEDIDIKHKVEQNQTQHSDIHIQQETEVEKVNFKSFKLLKELGSGAFGKVFLVKKKDDNQLYAMKALKKQTLILNSQLRYAVGEANILKQTEFPFILDLFYSFQTPRYLYLVIEYCQGNDLGFHLARNYTLTEDQAQFYIAELVLAVEYLHQKDIVYRDLKPENILLSEDRHIKLADFGLSKQGVKDEQTTSSFCGSPAYLAPELLNNKGSGKQADIYGIGAVLYEMLTGMPPYYHDDIPIMYKQIKAGRLTFPESVDDNARDLIKRLLNKNPKERIGAKSKSEIKNHPFFKGIDWQKLLNKEIEAPYLQNDDSDEEQCQQDIQQLIDDKTVNVRFYDKDYQKENENVNRVIKFSFSKK